LKFKFYLGLLFLFVILNIGQGSWGLTESSEARYAEIGREMVISGDYLHPQLLGISHYHKPPVTYYLTALGYQIFGVNEFGARFFLSVALIIQLLLVFKIALLLFKEEKIALWSAVIYLSFPVVLIATRNLTTDAYLTTFIVAAIFLWLKRKNERGLIYLYGFYAALGLAFLTKGPVVLLPVLTFIAVWKFINKERLRVTIHSVLGVFLMLAISASWFIAVVVDHPNLWDYFIIEQIVNRSFNAQSFHRDKPFWYYLLFAPLVGLPWFGFIITYFFKKRKHIKNIDKHVFIIAITVGVLLLVFSLFSSKLILYILPVYPFLALLGGYLAIGISQKRATIYNKIYLGFYALLVIALLVLIFYEKLSVNIPLAAILILFLIGFSLFLYRKKEVFEKQRLMGLTLGFTVGLLFVYTLFSSANADTINSVKDLMARVETLDKDNTANIIVYDNRLPSASFYLDKKIITIANGNYRAKRETEFEQDTLYKDYYYDLQKPEDLHRAEALMRGPKNILIAHDNDTIPDSLHFILRNFRNKEDAGKWLIYY
tara:strand:+ start:39398 stop:41026 length:1629 start_codon:yes stop_codon:yes gene_type:complete